MSYEIQEGYPKLRNVAKEDNALAIQYKSKFDEVNADIAGAQALIDDDPTSEGYNGDLVLNADKLNAICDSLDDLQPPFINAKETLAEWMMNFSKEVTEYDSTETYNYGEVVTYQDTSETIQSNAYTIDVPSGAKLATVQKYGGKSLVFNQLVQNGNFVDTSGWLVGVGSPSLGSLSVSNNVGTVVCSTLPSGNWTFTCHRLAGSLPPQGHKLLITVEVYCETSSDMSITSGASTIFHEIVPAQVWTKLTLFTTNTSWGDYGIGVGMHKDYVEIGTQFKVRNFQSFDLTQMFGAGNEPTTVEEAKALLPNDYYEYNTGEVIYADVDKVVEQGKNKVNPSAWHQGFLAVENGTQVSSNPYWLYTDEFVTVDPSLGITYGSNIDSRMVVYEYDSSKNYIGINQLSSVTSKNTTLTSDVKYLRFGYNINAGAQAVTPTSVLQYDAFCFNENNDVYLPYRHNEHPIPQAIRNLDGYGWSAGSAYNEVDFERKKFIKRVGRVDLGTFSYSYDASVSIFVTTTTLPLAKQIASNNEIANIMASGYSTTWLNDFPRAEDMSVAMSTEKYVFFRTIAYTDAPTFKSAMNGVYLYYELAEPVEIDITDILEPFNVEAGGTITFHNSNGDGYGIPVPSKIEFGHGINGTFICIDKNVTGAFNTSKWLMLTPSDLGFDLTDAEVIDNNGLVEIYLNDEMIAQVTPNLLYLDDEDNAQNGMVYLVQVDGDKYQLRYKDDSGNVNIINNETNASISAYESNSIQTELNRLKVFMERSD